MRFPSNSLCKKMWLFGGGRSSPQTLTPTISGAWREEATLSWKRHSLCAHTYSFSTVLILLLKVCSKQMLCLAIVCLAMWYLPERNDEPAYLIVACFSVCLPICVLCCTRAVVGARLMKTVKVFAPAVLIGNCFER